jgi:hypothetical protein
MGVGSLSPGKVRYDTGEYAVPGLGPNGGGQMCRNDCGVVVGRCPSDLIVQS